jgi:hypothetical protein
MAFLGAILGFWAAIPELAYQEISAVLSRGKGSTSVSRRFWATDWE